MTRNDTIKQNSTKVQKNAMIEALTKSLGIVTTACRQVDISRETHYRWMRKDKKYKARVDDIEDIALDFAESKLHKQIDKEDTTATIFFLKTKGKRRGYIERQEITGKEGKDIIPTIIFKNFTDE
jgi:hypothetical protein